MLRDWTESLKIDGISADAERLFTRLIMKADDFGRFHAEPRLVKAMCFPLIDNLRPNDLIRLLKELSDRQLILRYEAEGRSILSIVNFQQRLKESRAKFPTLPEKDEDWLATDEDFREVPGSSGKFPPRREVEEKTKSKMEGKTREARSPSAFPIPEELMNQEGFETEFTAFIENRKKLKKPMTNRAKEIALSTLAKRPQDAVALLRKAIERGWAGLEWDWLDNSRGKQPAKTVKLRPGESPPIFDPMKEGNQ